MAKLIYNLDITKTDTTHVTASCLLTDLEFNRIKQILSELAIYGVITTSTLTAATNSLPMSGDGTLDFLKAKIPHSDHIKKLTSLF